MFARHHWYIIVYVFLCSLLYHQLLEDNRLCASEHDNRNPIALHKTVSSLEQTISSFRIRRLSVGLLLYPLDMDLLSRHYSFFLFSLLKRFADLGERTKRYNNKKKVVKEKRESWRSEGPTWDTINRRYCRIHERQDLMKTN